MAALINPGATIGAGDHEMSRRQQVRTHLEGQLQAALRGAVGAGAGRGLSRDGEDMFPGRMFHVELSRERMEYGYDRRGDPGSDRPALMLRCWRGAAWLGLPGTWRLPFEEGHFLIRPVDWETYRRPGTPLDQYVCYWYERVQPNWLYNPVGDIRSERLSDLLRWVKAWHTKHPARLALLEDDGGKSN